MHNVMRLLFLTIAAIVVMAFLLLIVSPSLMVSSLINKHSESLFGLKAKCSSVKISVLNGTGVVKGLKIYNVAGGNDYHYNTLMSLNRLSFKINSKELLNKKVHFKSIEIIDPIVNYEQHAKYSNITRAISVIKDKSKDKNPEVLSNQVKDKSNYSVVIDDLLIKDMKANVYLAMIDEEVLSVAVPDINLRHIGGADGVSIKASFGDIMFSLNQHLMHSVVGSKMDALKRNIHNNAGDAVEKIKESFSDFGFDGL
ncbi:hypothetical protein CAXC1_150028 [Candidatus Xenohaliotis californiensis]|uniref:AsmA domain-containing protein n=1 Tax=Candidatus Xenohaliotis californiensis TaxID=84677 RepID=A0ABP0ERV0_9RICK|nr:hypothetical protein CAXC1_150028 [Candidatus Xenohaliotis californiensis]